jgi:purine-binding chemotaxis protein CheW
MDTIDSGNVGETGSHSQFLSFTLGGEDYGVNILRVREIKGWEEVRQLPDMPEYVKGVMDLRGLIVPIIDLRIRFKTGNVEYTPTTVTIVLSVEKEQGDRVMGIVVDGVSDVLDVMPGDIKAAPALGGNINARYIRGMVTIDKRMVILLDVDKLLSPDEMAAIQSMT